MFILWIVCTTCSTNADLPVISNAVTLMWRHSNGSLEMIITLPCTCVNNYKLNEKWKWTWKFFIHKQSWSLIMTCAEQWVSKRMFDIWTARAQTNVRIYSKVQTINTRLHTLVENQSYYVITWSVQSPSIRPPQVWGFFLHLQTSH